LGYLEPLSILGSEAVPAQPVSHRSLAPISDPSR
jgi:hypothetical protein